MKVWGGRLAQQFRKVAGGTKRSQVCAHTLGTSNKVYAFINAPDDDSRLPLEDSNNDSFDKGGPGGIARNPCPSAPTPSFDEVGLVRILLLCNYFLRG